jgi:hypothetical protein
MKLVPFLALLSVVGLAMVPVVAAHPINPSLGWSNINVNAGASTTAIVSVAIDADCPTGQTFSGTITVVQPLGGVATASIGTTACGTSALAVYPTGFTGVASTSEVGTYNATWAGSSSVIAANGQHPSFSVTDNFIVISFQPPPGVPQFGAPAIFIAAMGLVLVAAMKKGKVLNF